MNKKIIFISLYLILQKITFECPIIESIIKEDESKITSTIEKNINSLLKNSSNCIKALIKNVKLLSLEKYLSLLKINKINFSSSLEISINSFKKQLEDLHNKYKYSINEYKIISPAFQWAQSLNDIYIEIKFSHRFDSPGCLEVNNLNITITNQSVNLICYCILDDYPIKINFYIETFQEIDYENSTYGFFGLIGKYQIKLRKKNIGMFWDKLLKDGSNNFSNMGIWFEMKEKFEKEIKQFEDQIDNEKFNQEVYQIEKKSKEKKERRDKKKGRKNNNTNLNKTDL